MFMAKYNMIQFYWICFQSNYERYWPWHLERAKENYKYTIRKLIDDFLWVENNNICSSTVYELFTIKICMTLTLIFRMAQGQT